MEVHFTVNPRDGKLVIKSTGEKSQSKSGNAVDQAKNITEEQIYGAVLAEKERVAEVEQLKDEFSALCTRARNNDQQAQYMVAAARLQGIVHKELTIVETDWDEALYWFSLLMKHDYPKAFEKQQECIKKMNDRFAAKLQDEEKNFRKPLRYARKK